MTCLHSTNATRTHGSFWTPEEIARAKHMRLVERKKAAAIAAELGRTPATVYTQLRKFGVIVEEHRRWTCDMRRRLVEFVRDHGLAAAAAEFAIGEEGARYQLKMAGTSLSELRPRPAKSIEPTLPKAPRLPRVQKAKPACAARYWTAIEDNALRERAEQWTPDSGPDYDALVSDFPGRTREAIRLRVRTLGLEVTGKLRRSGREAAVVAAIRAGLHQSEIVRRTGVRHRTVLAIAERLGLTIKAFVAPPMQRAPVARVGRSKLAPGPAPCRADLQTQRSSTHVAIAAKTGLAMAPSRAHVATHVASLTVDVQPAQSRGLPAPIQLHRPAKPTGKPHRASTFNSWRKREVGKVTRDDNTAALIAAHIASKGVTRVAEAPHEAALNRLRRRGYVVTREGEAVLVDHRHRLNGPAEILAFADARGIA